MDNNIAVEVDNSTSGVWEDYASFDTSDTGNTDFTNDLDLVATADGHLHLVFGHNDVVGGDFIGSTRGVSYGEFDGSNWSFDVVEENSNPSGWLNADNPRLAIDETATLNPGHIVSGDRRQRYQIGVVHVTDLVIKWVYRGCMDPDQNLFSAGHAGLNFR